MKTLKQWLETLDEPYKTQAIVNCKDQNKTLLDDEELEKSLSDAIYCAFDWSKTTEGFNYWSELELKIRG